MVGSRFSSRAASAARPVSLVLAAGLAVCVLAACGGSSDSGSVASPVPKRPAADACAGVRPALGCRQLAVGGRTYRYSVQKPGGGRVRDAVLVDLGGPGSALFGSDDLLAFAAAWPKTGVLVFIEEPWVTRPVAPRCTAAISRFYRGLRGAPGGAAAADGLVSACDVARSGSWGWTPESYRRVVAAILAKEKLSLVGVVGSSYGAVHVEAVWSRPSVRWAILSSPAPRSATGAEYLAARRESAMAAVTRACKTCRSRRGTEKLVASAGAVLADAPVELRTRTPLVEPVDLYAALIATAYLSPAERDRFVAGLRSPRAMASEIGLLSDTTLLRYGEFDMSPAVLAYLDEVCRRYPSWPQAPSRGDGIGALLVALHRPCLELAPAAASSAAAPNEVCVAVGGADAVTPPAFARTWLESVDRARLVRVEKAAHGSPELARSCLRP